MNNRTFAAIILLMLGACSREWNGHHLDATILLAAEMLVLGFSKRSA